MGGIRVDADTQMSTVPGLFAAGECAAGINGANRLGGNSLSDLLVFGKRAGEHAAGHAGRRPRLPAVDDAAVQQAIDASLAPFDRASGENPFAILHDLQAVMQDLVGIVRTEGEMRQALDQLERFCARARETSVAGHREYHTGWHTAIDLQHLLTVSEAVTRSAIERRESRGGHFREDHPAKDPAFGSVNIVVRKRTDGGMEVTRAPLPELPAELKAIVEEMG
jgi:succinate dehydrogenase / fumarate reductase flavoprotein subunit